MNGGEAKFFVVLVLGSLLFGLHVGEQRQLGQKIFQRFVLAREHAELLDVIFALRCFVVIRLDVI